MFTLVALVFCLASIDAAVILGGKAINVEKITDCPCPAEAAPKTEQTMEPVREFAPAEKEAVRLPECERQIIPAAEPLVVPAKRPYVVPASEPLIVPASQPLVMPAARPMLVPAQYPDMYVQSKPQVFEQERPRVYQQESPDVVQQPKPDIYIQPAPKVYFETPGALSPSTAEPSQVSPFSEFTRAEKLPCIRPEIVKTVCV